MTKQRLFFAAVGAFLVLSANGAQAKIYDPDAQKVIPFVKTPETVDQKALTADVEIDIIQVGPAGAVDTKGKTKEELAKEYFDSSLPLPAKSAVLPPEPDDH